MACSVWWQNSVCSVISVELDVRIIVSEISQPLNYIYFTCDKKQKCLQGGNTYSLAVTDIHNLCDGFFFLNALFLCLWSFHILKYLLSCSHIQMSLKAVPFEVCVQTDWSFRHKGTSDMIVSLCECKISPPFEFIPCVLTWYKTSRFACGQKVLLSYNDRINQYPSGVSNDPSGI